MIFVTVGTHTQQFNRLVCGMDELADEIQEEIIIQYGHSSYVPQHAKGFQWAGGDVIDNYIRDARVVVGHTGSGTIIGCLNNNKPLVLVPRLARFDEHIDDHQLQLASVLVQANRAICVESVTASNLKRAIDKAVQLPLSYNSASKLKDSLVEQIIFWAQEKQMRLRNNL